MHTLNVIVSRTETCVGKVTRAIFGGYWNHCSISFDNEFKIAYSFSRYYKYLWFTGCYCREEMSRYADYVVFKIPITNKEYRRIGKFLKRLSGRYLIYDYIGAALSPFGISTHFKHHYICSTFVTRILSYVDSIELDKDLYKFSPMDVNNFFNQTKFKNNEKTKGEQ